MLTENIYLLLFDCTVFKEIHPCKVTFNTKFLIITLKKDIA